MAEAKSQVFFNGPIEIAKTGFIELAELFDCINASITHGSEDPNTYLMQLVMYTYNNDEAILKYLEEKNTEFDVNWSLMLEAAFSREELYTENYTKLLNLPVIRCVFTNCPDFITLSTYKLIMEHYIEHISRKEFSKKSILDAENNCQIYVGEYPLNKKFADKSFEPKDLFEQFDKYFKDDKSTREYSKLGLLVLYSYNNDEAILKYLIDKVKSNFIWSMILDHAARRRMMVGNKSKMQPNLLVMYYVLTQYEYDISIEVYKNVADYFLEHVTGKKHVAGLIDQ